MKKVLALIILSLIFGHLYSQQIPLEGIITVQNSRVNSGKLEFVSGASIIFNKDESTSTDNEGKFLLNFAGVRKGMQIGIEVSLKAKYKDYVVVNEREIKNITLGRKLPVKIYICDKAELDSRKAKIFDINVKKQDEVRERKIKELNEHISRLEQANAYESEEYQKIIDNLTIITSNRIFVLSRIEDYVKRMIVVNLDEVDSVCLHAYRLFEQGELDSVSHYLDSNFNYENECVAMRKLKSNVKVEKDFETQLATNDEKNRKNIIEKLLLNARSKALLYLSADAIYLYEKVVELDANNAEHLFEYANYLHEIREYSKAESLYLRCLKINEKLSKKNPKVFLPDLATVLNNLGLNYYYQSKYVKSESMYLRSLEIYEELAQANPKSFLHDLADVLYNLGNNYYSQKIYAKSEEMYLRCLEINEELAKNNSEQYYSVLPSIMFRLIQNGVEQNDYDKNEKYFWKLYEFYSNLLKEKDGKHKASIYEELFKESHLDYLITSLYNRGVDYYYQQSYTKSEEMFLYCLEIVEKLVKDESDVFASDLVNVIDNLAIVCQKNKKYQDAITYASRSFQLCKEKISPSANIVYYLGKLSFYTLYTQEYDATEKYANEAISLDNTQIWIKSYLAHALLLQGKYEKAWPVYQEIAKQVPQNKNKTCGEICVEDLENLSSEGLIPEEHIEEVRKVLNYLKSME